MLEKGMGRRVVTARSGRVCGVPVGIGVRRNVQAWLDDDKHRANKCRQSKRARMLMQDENRMGEKERI